MAAIKSASEVKVGMVFLNKKNNENVGVTKVNEEENKVTFALSDGSEKEYSMGTVTRWFKFVSEAPKAEEKKAEPKKEEAPAPVEEKKAEPKKAEKPAKKEEPKKETKPAESTGKRGRKRSPESIETFCLELLKEGGTVSEMAASLEEILKEKKIAFTDAKMRVRRAIYYCEKEAPGYKLDKDNSNGRGNTIYKLVEKK